MTAQSNSNLLASRLRWIPQAASASAVLVGCLVLIGWWLDAPFLKSLWSGAHTHTIKATTALTFVLTGVSLWLSRGESTNALSRRLAQVCASIVVLVGLLTISEYLFAWDLGLDQLLTEDLQAPAYRYHVPGRMAFATALDFLLLGGVLLLLDVKTSRGHQPAEYLAVAVAVSAFLSLVAHLYGGIAIHHDYPLATVSPPVAFLFAALTIGVLFARSQHRIVSIMTSDTAAAAAMRRLLVVAILLPISAGWVRLLAQQYGFFGTEFGLALIVVFGTIALSSSIYWQAASLIQAEEYQRGINEVAMIFGQTLTPETAFPGFAAVIKKIVPYDRMCVVVREGESLVAMLSFADPALPCYQGKAWRSSGDTAVDWVMTHKTPRLVRDLAAAQIFADEAFIAREGIRSVLILPLLVGGETVGSVALDSRMPGAYTQAHVTALTGFVEPLAAAVQNGRLHAKVLHYTDQLEHLVEARTRELHTANGHLADASRHKSAFLANMSHELRTPLNAILGFVDLLQDQISGPLTEKQTRYANHIQTSGRHLLALINDLLDLSKVEAGKLTLRLEPFNLSEALAAAVYETHPLADAKRLTLTLDVDTAPATLTADPIRFKQILYNLLSNAIKFSQEGGQVTVATRRALSVEHRASSVEPQPATLHAPPSTLYPESDFVEIAVTDSGIGITSEDLSRLFQRFTQLETTTTKHHQGTGLGLALTRQLVELHGGTIEAASAGEGQGSTFTVRLPLAPHASPEN